VRLPIGTFVGGIAVGACAFAAASGWAALPAPVTLNGVGGVKPGMRVAAVEQRWGVDLVLSGEITPGCETAPVRAGAMRGYALFERGRFSAVFLSAGARTGRGLRIGSPVRRLKALHGPQLTSRPDFYVPGSRNYFLRRPGRPRWSIRFDVSRAGRITEISFGNRAVRYVEGCA
jgi:hypothetical protein